MHSKRFESIVGEAAISLLVLGFFIAWVELDAAGLHTWAGEDGPIETLSAIFFAVSSLCFVIAARRSRFLKEKTYGLRYPLIIAWALLMFIFFGEEISWGQRLFGFETPEALSAVNKQGELNIHNIEFVDSFLGGKYRYLSIMMIATGLLLPVAALTQWGKKTIQWWGFPVAPLGYGVLFVGAYIFGKYYRYETLMSNDAAEVREFLMSVAMMLFAMHGAMRPCVLFRACDPALPSSIKDT